MKLEERHCWKRSKWNGNNMSISNAKANLTAFTDYSDLLIMGVSTPASHQSHFLFVHVHIQPLEYINVKKKN